MFKYAVLALALTEASLAAPRPVFHPRRQAPPAVAGVAAATGSVAPVASTTSAAAVGASGAAAGGNSTVGGGATTGASTYTKFSGDGSTGAGWPDNSKLIADFPTLWNINLAEIKASCVNNKFDPNNNSDQENSDLQSAITSQASSSGIDARLILAIVMQESKGCVRVPTTAVTVQNPGLMQDNGGSNTCNPAQSGQASQGVNPCPTSKITGMISDGATFGSNSLQAALNAAKNKGAAQGFFQAAFLYNGGVNGNQADLTGTTACYASDVANRLLGWNELAGPNTCAS